MTTKKTFVIALVSAVCVLLLSGCWRSFGPDHKPACNTDTDCLSGLECSADKDCVCTPSSCLGCCSPDGRECHNGNENIACGGQGDVCSDCTEFGLFCSEATMCVTPNCTDDCLIPGDRRCIDESSFEECSDTDGDGCLDWSTIGTCTDNEHCIASVCVDQCAEGCISPGDVRCADSGHVQECQDFGECLGWSVPQPCPDDQHCEADACVPGCGDECPLDGDIFCLEGGLDYQQCGEWDDDECLEWGGSFSCDPGFICEEGSCNRNCTGRCEVPGRTMCTGSAAYVTCSEPDVFGCQQWSEASTCPEGTECVEGECVCSEEECTEGDTTCIDDLTQAVCVIGSEGCPVWSSPERCDTEYRCIVDRCQFCECTETESRCDPGGTDAVQNCRVIDGCGTWTGAALTPCAVEAVCDSGTCIDS